MVAFIVILAVLLIGLFVFIYIKKRNADYAEYVKRNSLALKELHNLNEKYPFTEVKSFDESYVYDNEDFYNNISCRDYLIYQLQFLRNEMFVQCSKANFNRGKNELYCREVSKIKSFDAFDNEKYKNKNLLRSIERKLFDKGILKPVTEIEFRITLQCSTINDKVYASKTQTFNQAEIELQLGKLANKHGSFYNDRDIWDSLCRVERGKVSNKMRFSIYQRDGYRCRYCGRSGRFADLEIDHIKPISKGGKSTYDNLQTLCRRCNKEKGNSY